MKTNLKTLFCFVGAILLSTTLHAQSESSGKSMLTVHIGPSWQVGHLMGITNTTDAYRSDLRKGLSWDAAYWYVGQGPLNTGVRIAPGFLYEGSTYKSTHDTGADEMQMHYLAPQFGVFFIRNHFQLQAAAGVGYQFYKNQSTVYDKARDVSMNRLACNLSLSGEYFLTRYMGVSAQLNWVFSNSDSYKVVYHDTTWEVANPKSGYGYYGQLSLLLGLNFHF